MCSSAHAKKKEVINKIVSAKDVVSQMLQPFIYRAKKKMPLTIHTIRFIPNWGTTVGGEKKPRLLFLLPRLSEVP